MAQKRGKKGNGGAKNTNKDVEKQKTTQLEDRFYDRFYKRQKFLAPPVSYSWFSVLGLARKSRKNI